MDFPNMYRQSIGRIKNSETYFTIKFMKIENRKIGKVEGRFYHTPNGLYPSVTTMLGFTKDDKGVVEWRKRVGDRQADYISKTATNIGTQFHQVCEDFLNGKGYIKAKHPVANNLFYKVQILNN